MMDNESESMQIVASEVLYVINNIKYGKLE